MADRAASAIWHGNLFDGSGTVSALSSGLFTDAGVNLASRTERRVEDEPRGAPRAAHAALLLHGVLHELSTPGASPGEAGRDRDGDLEGGRSPGAAQVSADVPGADEAALRRPSRRGAVLPVSKRARATSRRDEAVGVALVSGGTIQAFPTSQALPGPLHQVDKGGEHWRVPAAGSQYPAVSVSRCPAPAGWHPRPGRTGGGRRLVKRRPAPMDCSDDTAPVPAGRRVPCRTRQLGPATSTLETSGQLGAFASPSTATRTRSRTIPRRDGLAGRPGRGYDRPGRLRGGGSGPKGPSCTSRRGGSPRDVEMSGARLAKLALRCSPARLRLDSSCPGAPPTGRASDSCSSELRPSIDGSVDGGAATHADLHPFARVEGCHPAGAGQRDTLTAGYCEPAAGSRQCSPPFDRLD